MANPGTAAVGSAKVGAGAVLSKTLGKSMHIGMRYGLPAAFAIDTFRAQREKGRNLAVASAVTLGTTYLWNAFQWPLLGLQLAPLGSAVGSVMNQKTAALQRAAAPNSAFGFQDSAGAQTSRARALLAINESRLNARSYLGSEAGLFAARYR